MLLIQSKVGQVDLPFWQPSYCKLFIRQKGILYQQSTHSKLNRAFIHPNLTINTVLKHSKRPEKQNVRNISHYFMYFGFWDVLFYLLPLTLGLSHLKELTYLSAHRLFLKISKWGLKCFPLAVWKVWIWRKLERRVLIPCRDHGDCCKIMAWNFFSGCKSLLSSW